MGNQGRRENTNSVNFWMKQRYKDRRIAMKDKDAWLAKLVDPAETPGLARWAETERGARILERDPETLTPQLIDNLIILREVFGLKHGALKTLLRGGSDALEPLEQEVSRRETLAEWQAELALRGELVLKELRTAERGLRDINLDNILSMAPHHVSLGQLAALRALKVAQASDRPSAVWEAIDGYLQLGEAEPAEAMLDAHAPDAPGAPLEAVALRAALAELRARQAIAAARTARFWRDEADAMSAAEMHYEHLAMEEEDRALRSVENMVDRSFTILAAADAAGLRKAGPRLSQLKCAGGVLKTAKLRLLRRYGSICAQEKPGTRLENSDLPTSAERRRLLAALAKETLEDREYGEAARRVDAGCILRHLAADIMAAHRENVDRALLHRHSHRDGASPFTDPAILALVEDLEAWWRQIEPEWLAAADQDMRKRRFDLARELVARKQEAEGPQAAIAELQRLAGLGWIEAMRPDGGPSPELTILAGNWVWKTPEIDPPEDIRKAAEDKKNQALFDLWGGSDGEFYDDLDDMQSRLENWRPAGWNWGLSPLLDAAPER